MHPVEIASAAVGGQEKLAELIEVTQSFVSQMANKRRPVPPHIAVKIETATKGAVTRADLCPDDYRDLWPEFAAKLDRQHARAVS